ncbi:MAG: filamentous hemagglutinin N-terminal domain-containing protein [Acidimicrobiia bacterium]
MASKHPNIYWVALLRRALLSGVLLLTAVQAVSQAQVTTAITSDGTLGTTVNQVGTDFNIEGGNRPANGPNLFHSFGLFSVGAGDVANFNNETSMATTNILSRVTGGNPSNIFGTIQTTGFPGANLFLLNPAGVLFGPEASLNVSGSFHVSTAEYLRLTDDVRFNAIPGPQDSMLTVAPPAAFGFLSQNPARIAIQESVLEVLEGNTLSFVGGDVEIVGGTLEAPSGRINIASVASAGEVPINILDLALDTFERLGQIDVSQNALISTSGDGGGTIVIRGGILMVDRSDIFADTLGDVPGASLAIDIGTADSVIAARRGRIRAQVDGAAAGGNVRITTRYLEVTGGARVDTTTEDSGRGGNLEVNADHILLSGVESGRRSGLRARSEGEEAGSGDGGNVLITTRRLEITEGATITATSEGPGRAGDIEVTAQEIFLAGVEDGERATISAKTEAAGDGGTIRITTGTLELRDGGEIEVEAEGTGRGGNIDITATSVVLAGVEDGERAQIDAKTEAAGDGGTIRITTGTLELRDGGEIEVATEGTGRGGNIDITATSVVLAGVEDGKRAQIDAKTEAGGDGGDVRITTGTLELRDGGEIEVAAEGAGRGGNITIMAGQEVLLENGSTISANSTGPGNAGNITIHAGNLYRSEDSAVTTEAETADGGNIQLIVGSLVDLIDSQITATVKSGVGGGGNILIDPRFVILDRSQIRADAFGGPGGNVTIVTGVFLASPDSVVSASSALGVAGRVDIRAPVTNLSGTLAPLPEAVLQATALLREACAARAQGGQYSSLVLGGRDGLPWEPGGLLPSPLYREKQAGAPSAGYRESAEQPAFSVGLPGADPTVLAPVRGWSEPGFAEAIVNLACSK